MQSCPPNYEGLVQETYEALLRNGDIAIDVGAHVGRHALPMAERVFPAGQVLAFEPLPMCRARLENEVAAYRGELGHILKVFPCALSNYAGSTEYVVAKNSLAYSGLKKRMYLEPAELEFIPIEVKRLDDVCENLPSVRFIKIDAEGGEYHILKGAVRTLQRCRPAVTFEFGMNSLAEYQVTPLQMAQFWAELGYHIFNILGARLTEQEFVSSSEVQSLWDYVAVPAEDVAMQRTVVEVLSKTPDWHRVSVHLDYAHHQVNLFDNIPPLVGFRGLKGWLVKRVARLLFHLNQVVTVPQKACCQYLLYSTRALLHILRDRANEEANLNARLENLTAQVADMRQLLVRQQQEFTSQSELLAQARNQLARLAQTTIAEKASKHASAFDQAA